MNIIIGTATKEINSTFVPNLTKSIDVQLKFDTSLTSPVILIGDDVYSPEYNYCYIPKWKRYYFLHDPVIQTGGIWAVTLAIDVLASWKNYILNTTAYVHRSASNWNAYLQDPTWSHDLNDMSLNTYTIDVGLNTGGSYLLFTASDDGGASAAAPATSCYVVTGSQLRSICSYMFSSSFFSTASAGLSAELSTLAKTVFNPFQYVLKCMWVPFAVSEFSSIPKNISFGWWDSEVSAGAVTIPFIKKDFSFTLGGSSDWTHRDASWTKNEFYVPGFGQMELSPEYQGKTIKCEYTCDTTTGDASLFIYANDQLIQSATGKLGCDIQLSGLYEDFVSDFGGKTRAIASGIRAGIGAGVNFLKAGSSVKLGQKMAAVQAGYTYEEANLSEINPSALAESVVNGAQQALQPSMSSIGANGTKAIIQNYPNALLTVRHYNLLEDIHVPLGGVLNRIVRLGTLSGYCEVVNPHINAPATSLEITMLNSFMSGGFYIE